MMLYFSLTHTLNITVGFFPILTGKIDCLCIEYNIGKHFKTLYNYMYAAIPDQWDSYCTVIAIFVNFIKVMCTIAHPCHIITTNRMNPIVQYKYLQKFSCIIIVPLKMF